VNETGATIEKSVLLLKDGTLGSFESFEEVILDTSEGGIVIPAGDLSVDSAIGGGSVQLSNSSKLTVNGTVSGATGIIVASPVDNTVYAISATNAENSFVMNETGYLAAQASEDSYHWVYTSLSGYAATVTSGDLHYNSATLKGALSNCAENALITLTGDCTEAVDVPVTVQLNLNGHSIAAVTVADGKTLYGFDSNTADFNISDGKYGKILEFEGNVVGAPATTLRDVSMLIEEADGISFHAVSLNIDSMALRPSEVGLYFNNNFRADELALDNIQSYGVAMSTQGAPGEKTMQNPNHYTAFKKNTDGTMTAGTSSLLYGVMKAANTDAANQKNAATPVYGRAYVKTTDGQYLFGYTQMRSLQEQVELADEKYTPATMPQNILDLYSTYASVMDSWNIPNIQAAANAPAH